MPWRFKDLGENVKAAGAVLALVGTLFGFVSYFSDLIHTQAATVVDVQKLHSRMSAVEDVLDKTNLDRFRIERSEQDVAKLSRQIEDVQKNVFDIRVMLEKFTASRIK